jgi:hypothetical protein
MSKPTFEQRCLLAEQCLPDAPYREMLKKLHTEMLEAHAAQPAVPDAFGTREGEHPQYIQGWNDCRAEMLSMRKRVKP